MKLGVVILNYNTSNSVVNLINKIQNYSDIDYIVIVDNNSAKEDSQLLRKVISNKVEVIYSKENSGYASGNNIGIRRLIDDKKVDVVVICNPDIFFENEVIKKIKETFKNNLDYAILGSHRVDGKNQHTQRQYWKLPTFKSELKELSIIFDNSKIRNTPYFNQETYYQLQSILQNNRMPEFYNCNLLDISKYTKKAYDVALFSNVYHYLSLNAKDYRDFLNKINSPEILALYTWILNGEKKKEFLANGFDLYQIPGVLHQDDYIVKLSRRKQ